MEIVLVKSYESGLLDVPAKAQIRDVAKREGVSKSTFGEHLQKSIHRIVQNSYPILKLHDERSRKK